MFQRLKSPVWAAAMLGCLASPAFAAEKAAAHVQVRQTVADGTDGETILNIEVANRGPTVAKDVVVSGPIPAGYKLQSSEPRAKSDREQLSWAIGKLEPESKQTVRLVLIPTDDNPPELTSEFGVTFHGEIVAVMVAPAKPAPLSLKVEVDEATAGRPVAVQVRITNSTERMARDIVLQATLPAGLTHPKGSELENAVGDLGPGKSKVVRLLVTPEKAGEYVGRLAATGSTGTKRGEFRILTRSPSATLLAKDPATVDARTLVEVECTAKLHTKETARNTSIRVLLPEGIAFVDGGTATYSPDTRTVTWELGDLELGVSRTVRLEVVARAPGEHRIKAELRGTDDSLLGTTTATIRATRPVGNEGRPP
jgi:uncharacterized repeat protein (TIGR01451 family)